MLAEQNLEYYQYNLVAIFLNVLIRIYIIYVEQPYGFEEGDRVCLLLKALYGLKQALLLQYNKFTKFVRKYSFDLFLSDAYVFRNASTSIIIVIYVDDVLIIVRLLVLIFETANLIKTVFPIRLLRELYYYLGIRIIRNRETRQLIVVQDAYLDKIATKFNIYRLYPIAIGILLSKAIVVQLRAALTNYKALNKLKTKY